MIMNAMELETPGREAEGGGARRPWRVIAAAVALSIGVLLIAAWLSTALNRPTPVSRSEFTDKFGRACITVTTREAVAADCDFAPFLSGRANA